MAAILDWVFGHDHFLLLSLSVLVILYFLDHGHPGLGLVGFWLIS